jgi:hypothetical protein
MEILTLCGSPPFFHLRATAESLQGERSENVVSSYAKRGEVQGKEIPSSALWAIRVCVFLEPNARLEHDHRAR